MSQCQLALVRDAVATYKAIRPDLARGLPFWPLGLPGWTDEWLALGMRTPDDRTSYVLVWRRGCDPELGLPVGHLAGREVSADILHPSSVSPGSAVWSRGGLRVSLPCTPAVLLVRLVA
ncbi:hypothetical protein AB0C70_10155 [Streptomyces sp. NPDC048564]|uniref:hypothetical protein n=1 Tax=Streptomyces sp. NPDC048564 TaxID=3155760 RepID=UPI003425609E